MISFKDYKEHSKLPFYLKPLRKTDLRDIIFEEKEKNVLNQLLALQKARVSADPFFDTAYIFAAEGSRGSLAIIWLTPVLFDKQQLICTVLPLQMKEDLLLWQNLLDTVHAFTRFENVYSLAWLLDSQQKELINLLEENNYKITCDEYFYSQVPDYLRYKKNSFLLVDSCTRLDYGMAFVSYKFGWLVIKGDHDSIFALDFIRSKERVEDAATLWQGQRLGLIDEQDQFIEVSSEDLNKSYYGQKVEDYFAPEAVRSAADQLSEFLGGNLKEFDLQVSFVRGSKFQQKVWQAISEIPYGLTATYEELAAKVRSHGQKPQHLARAVGSACGANPIPLVIPCHRIIGKNGKLTGFSGGIDIKEFLLNLEMFSG